MVLGYYLNSEDARSRRTRCRRRCCRRAPSTAGDRVLPADRGYTGNLPLFLESAAGAGHFNPLVDDDGVIRRVPMLAEYDGAYYEALSLAVVRTLLGLAGRARLAAGEPGFPPQRRRAWSGSRSAAAARSRSTRTRRAGALSRRARAASATFRSPTCSTTASRRSALKGKIALVGTTAPGLFDLRATPVGRVYPGVEVHANLIAGMLDGKMKSKPAYVLGAEVVLLLVGGIALAILIPLLSALWATRRHGRSARC